MNDRETLEVHLNVLGKFDPVMPEEFRRSRFVFLGNGSPMIQRKVLEQMPDAELVVADTMDLWINIQHDELLDLFKRIDGLVLNDSEARLLTERGKPGPRRPRGAQARAEVRRDQKGRAWGDVLRRERNLRHARLPHARRHRSDRRGRQLRRRHDGLPGRTAKNRSARR